MAGAIAPRRSRGLFPWRAETLTTLRDEMQDLMSRFWDEEEEDWFSGALKPSVDLAETDKAVELRMDLPGVKPEDIEIQIQDNRLIVSGERKEEKEEKGKTFHRTERRTGAFSRSFALPTPVAEDEVAAEYHEGVLTVTLPKTEVAQTRRIKVKG